MRYFDRLHPIAAGFYFVTVLLIAMMTMDPVMITVCYLTGVCFCGILIGLRKLLSSLAYSIPLMLMVALTNPIFVHRGETILFFLNDNPVTVESIVYGVFAAMMIMSVFYWCRCYGEIMTSDKFVYLFGRVVPKLSLVFSMVLGFLPKMKRRFREIDEAQHALGIYSTRGYVDRIRSKMRVLSILLTGSLENSVDSADSMRARGYGLRGRSSYANYRIAHGDVLYLILTAVLGAAIIVLILLDVSSFSYYPVIDRGEASVLTYILYGALTLLTGASIVTEVKENILWRYLRSKI